MRQYTTPQCVSDCVTYGWSQNWAAVVGIGVCLVLLIAWFRVQADGPEEDE